MMSKKEWVELAEKIHGHLSPGITLGIRMAEIAYGRLGTKSRGKGLIGVAETRMCIPDALQAVAGTTPGNKRLVVMDYGKLALSIVKEDTLEGYRVSLRKEAAEVSESAKKFIFRLGRLSKDEMRELSPLFLDMDEKYFEVKKIKLATRFADPKLGITECEVCGELQPENYVAAENGQKICLACKNGRYYEEI